MKSSNRPLCILPTVLMMTLLLVSAAPVYGRNAVNKSLPAPAGVKLEPTETAFILSWTASEDGGAAGYRIHIGSMPGQYESSVTAGNVLQYTLSDVNRDLVYFIAVTAYDVQGRESVFSSEVVGKLLDPAPSVLLKADPPSGQKAGQPVDLSAAGTGRNVLYQYKFTLDYDGMELILQDYSLRTECVWDTRMFPPKEYALKVLMQESGKKPRVVAEGALTYMLLPPGKEKGGEVDKPADAPVQTENRPVAAEPVTGIDSAAQEPIPVNANDEKELFESPPVNEHLPDDTEGAK